MKNKKVWILVGSLMIVILAVGIWKYSKPSAVNTVPKDEISAQVVSYINNILMGQATASLVEVIEESGVYKITFDIDGQQYDTYATLDGKLLFPEGLDLTDTSIFEETTAPTKENINTTIGGFIKTGEDPCLKDGKPIVYYFGNSDCPFCLWQYPVLIAAIESLADYVVFKDFNNIEGDMEVFQRYSEGGVPLIVIGCSYARTGAGGREGEEETDKSIISALICKLTGGQPQEVCSGLEEIMSQI